MKLTERISRFRKQKNKETTENTVNEIENLYIEKKENGEENPIDDTVEQIIQTVQNNPSPTEVRKLIIELIERKNISDKIVEKTVIELSKKKGIQNSIIVEAIDEAETSISDNSIRNIVEKGDMDIEENLELIQQMQDKEEKQQAKQEQIEQQRTQAKQKLKKLYSKLTEINEREIADEIVSIKEELKPENIDEETNELIQNIIAQKMAEDYYDDSIKGVRMYAMSQAMPTDQMIERDLATSVQERYKEIEEDRGNKKGRFIKREFKKLILNEMGRQIGIEYGKTGTFNIPHSKQLSQMTKDEKKYLLEVIKTHTKKTLTKEDTIDITRQINEANKEMQKKENQIINLIKQIPTEEKSRIIDILTKIMTDKNAIETIEMLMNTGVIQKLGEIPEEKRKKSIEAINSAVTKRPKYKASPNPPKITGATFTR